MIPTTMPHGRTARRLQWSFLPPYVRALVEERCGSPVIHADSQDAGFTPGLASVLECADGSRHFVKAASVKAQRAFATAYSEEARKLAALPAETPAPRLLWVHEDDLWVVLGLEHVAARSPGRPWQAGELDALLDTLEVVADVLTPAPPGLVLDDIATELAAWPGYWQHLATDPPHDPGARRLVADHLSELSDLAHAFLDLGSGQTVVHTDVRDDNVLLTPDGRALLCDWNWPVLGPGWFDSVVALIGPRGDGLDVEAVLSGRRLTRDVPAEHVDALLAIVAGYFWRQEQLPVPPTSPWVRDAQRWQGAVVLDWLAERRGWA